jgi:hypothetical protein
MALLLSLYVIIVILRQSWYHLTTMESAIVETQPQIITPHDNDAPWLPQPGEPHMWNERFTHYYLTQPSVNRSILQAYRQYKIDTATTDDERTEAHSTMNVGEGWYRQAGNWQWVERAQAYDHTIANRLLEQNANALLVHKAHKLNLWSQCLEQASRELANRDTRELSHNQLLSTIKTINREYHAELPQQPQQHLHIHALHPDLQKAIRDAIEKRK